MTTIKMGVIDVPYVNAPSPRQKKVKADTVTTGDVAEWLEEDYAVMQTYLDVKRGDIAEMFERSVEGAMENLMMGAPMATNVYAEAASEIEAGFKKFLSDGEMDRLGVAGVPTQAAQDRASGKKRSSRMKKKRKGTKPVSFIDTGLYQASAKVWAE